MWARMVQKEVAERLVAAPRSAAYGRLSVLTQWLCAPRSLFDIPARAFTPPPRVVSSVVAVTPRAEPLAAASLAVLEQEIGNGHVVTPVTNAQHVGRDLLGKRNNGRHI